MGTPNSHSNIQPTLPSSSFRVIESRILSFLSMLKYTAVGANGTGGGSPNDTDFCRYMPESASGLFFARSKFVGKKELF